MIECMDELSSYGILALQGTLATQSTLFTVSIEQETAHSNLAGYWETGPELSLFFDNCSSLFISINFRNLFKNIRYKNCKK